MIKKKRGRPKGSKNKLSSKKVIKEKKVKKAKKTKKTISKVKDNVIKKKRGRPKGSKNKTTVISAANKPCTEYDMSNVKVGKHLGYCPKCDSSIATYNLDSKFIFICDACGKRGRTKILKVDSKRLCTERPQSKKEYMESSMNVDYHDMPAHLTIFPGLQK